MAIPSEQNLTDPSIYYLYADIINERIYSDNLGDPLSECNTNNGWLYLYYELKARDTRLDLSEKACIEGWGVVFSLGKKEQSHISQYSALSVAELCAISVDINPHFADMKWIVDVAIPMLDIGFPRMESNKQREKWIGQLNEFLRRVDVVQRALKVGEKLQPVTNSDVTTLIRAADAVAFAESRNPPWKLPPGFPKPAAAADAKDDKGLSQRAENTYLHIIGALHDILMGRSPHQNLELPFKTQDELLEALEKYKDFDGMSRRTLEDKFARAKRAIASFR